MHATNRKYLTCAQKVAGSLFIMRNELKGMTEENNRKLLLSSPESVGCLMGGVGSWASMVIMNIKAIW